MKKNNTGKHNKTPEQTNTENIFQLQYYTSKYRLYQSQRLIKEKESDKKKRI